MVGIDTNILIYAYDKGSPIYQRAKTLLSSLIYEGNIAIADLSLLEFYSVITDGRKISDPLSSEKALKIIEIILKAEEFKICGSNIYILFKVFNNSHFYKKLRYAINDVYIATTLAEHGISKILTRNVSDFKKFDFIQAVNPFEDAKRIADSSEIAESDAKRHAPSASRIIPYGRQSITEKDVAEVCSVLRSNFLTQGPKVPEFEQAVADKVNAKHAVAVNSATSALHLACRALDVGKGDLVWTSPITFVASANCARYCGADVDFVDIDPHTYNMSVSCLEAKLEQAKYAGKLPKVLIPVHMCGQSCDMASIHALSEQYGFSIIEDASHAIGGYYKNEPVGNCQYSDITIFSFHPVKIITTAEGGMAVTNSSELADRMSLLRSHGITRDPAQMTKEPDAPWYYEQIDLGYNYRMTDIQAALGLSQLRRLDKFVSRRQELAKRYDRSLADLPLITPWQHPDTYSAWHLYVIRLDLEKTNSTRRQVFEYLRENAIGVNVHYIPVYTQPNYQNLGFKIGHCPEAEKYYQAAITLPLFPAMTEEDQDRVVEVLKETLPTEHTEGHRI